MKQVHTCTLAQCLCLTKEGRPVCKRRAPWPLSDEDRVDDRGNWWPQRTYGYLNSWTPVLVWTLRCNTDTKILTNTGDALNVTFYTTSYAAKKQGRSHNVSALLAKGLPFHFDSDAYVDDICERQRMLVFRAINVLNREQEISTPMVTAYLMGWEDVFCSHHYTPVYWSGFVGHILRADASLWPTTPSSTASSTGIDRR
ncbi:hypothetical protein OF83DRAFT_1070619 [Amylostereum chailletii]|nr:hypothetical protein OF83DRAFT_1070619 [Amylostereum chailletii]